MSTPHGGQRQRSKGDQGRNPSCVLGCGNLGQKHAKYGFVLCVACEMKIELINSDAKAIRRAIIRQKYPPVPVP